MGESTAEFVVNHPLFCHHNHHRNFQDFDADRLEYDFRSLLGYAEADLITADGARPDDVADDAERVAALWPKIRTTGYGRAVTLGCRELFGIDFAPENFEAITEALQGSFQGKSAAEVYDHFVREKARTKWVLEDGGSHYANDVAAFAEGSFPSYYRFTWRMDRLFSMTDDAQIRQLEAATGIAIGALDELVEAMNASVSIFQSRIRLGALKIGMAYQRELGVTHPSRREAEAAFGVIRGRNATSHAAPEGDEAHARQARPLCDHLFHCLMQRADGDDIPVQIHTGYLAGNWSVLDRTRAALLIPIFDRYRKVRFDIFHGSWPWMSELGAVAKSYPNVYPDLSWAWAMNPAASERALSEWLDAVPYNKILAYGADTNYPWNDVGYAAQARRGIASVLDGKVKAGRYSSRTAEEVAEAIMLRNGEELFGVS